MKRILTIDMVDDRSLYIYSSVLPTPSAVYLVGLAKSFASYTLHITALSPADGSLLATYDVPSNIQHGPSSIFVLHRLVGDLEHARVLWIESNQINSVKLTPELKEKPTAVKGSAYRELVDLGLNDHGLLVAVKDDGSGLLVKLNDEGTALKIIWEFADSASCTTLVICAYILTSGIARLIQRSILRRCIRAVWTKPAILTLVACFGLTTTRYISL